MSLFVQLVGVGLITVALRGVFQTLFRPSGRGIMSRTLTRVLWRRVFRPAAARSSHAALALAGPVALLAVLLT